MKSKKLKLKSRNLIFPFNKNKWFLNIVLLLLGLMAFFIFSIIPLLSIAQKKSEFILKSDNYIDYTYNIKTIISKEISNYSSKTEFIEWTSAEITTFPWLTSVDLSTGTWEFLLTVDNQSYPIVIDSYNFSYFTNPYIITYTELSNYINNFVWRNISHPDNTPSWEHIVFKSETKGEDSYISISNISSYLNPMFLEKDNYGKESFNVNESMILKTGSSFLTGSSLFSSSPTESYDLCILKQNCKVSIKVLNLDSIKDKITFSIKIKRLDSSSVYKEFILKL